MELTTQMKADATYIKLLNEKQFDITYTDNLSASTLEYWKEKGLIQSIEIQQDSTYSIIELVWLSIIADMRDLKIEYAQIQEVKKGFFSRITDNEQKYTILEYYMTLILEFNLPIFLVINQNEMLLVNDKLYIRKLTSGVLEKHITISLNKQIRDTIKHIYKSPNYSTYIELSKEDRNILKHTRNKNFKQVVIQRKNGKIDLIEKTRVAPIKHSKQIIEWLEEEDFQDIQITRHRAENTYISSTTRKKIDDH